jgi:Holliday junction resolvase RusA-like endonuclease
MTNYRREDDPITYKKGKVLSDDIKIIQLICQKRYKEAIKLLVELC